MLDRRGSPSPLALGHRTDLGTTETLKLPRGRLNVRRYAPRPASWPDGLRLRIVLITDIHAGVPLMSLERIAEIVDAARALAPDLVLLGGDYVSSLKLPFRLFHAEEWAAVLGRLSAPLGVRAVLGNHDHKQRPGPGRPPDDGRSVRAALHAVGIPVMANDVVKLETGRGAFNLVGLASQRARKAARRWVGDDDLPGALSRLDDAPAILLAHEPDIFPAVPRRVALTLAGHTHGGQVRLFDRAHVVPSRYGERYAWGHVVEDERHLVVSGGVGVSGWPIRFGILPEIVVVDLGLAPGA